MKVYVVLLLMALGSCNGHVSCQKPPLTITVFVHGTLLAGLLAASPQILLSGHVSLNSTYVQAVKRARDHLELFEETPLLEQGLVEIPAEYVAKARSGQIAPNKANRAAYFVSGAYDQFFEATFPHAGKHVYAVYGWSGIISQHERKKSGLALYEPLRALRDQYADEYEVAIELVCFSHGGNVALWLAEAERKYQRNLQITSLVMLGTPVQAETVRYIASPVFKDIFLLHSDDDGVQGLDTISTKREESFTHMSHLANLGAIRQQYPELLRCDIRVVINHHDIPICHGAFFQLLPAAVHPDAGLLPLVAFVPAIVSKAHQHAQCTNLDAHIVFKKRQVHVHMGNGDHGHCLVRIDEPSINLYPVMIQARKIVHNWRGKSQGFVGQALRALNAD